MVNSISLKNFGLINSLEWAELGKINLIIGNNGTGKTFLLKAIYSSLKTLETYGKGNENRTESEILSDRLYWTFQTTLGNIVSKGADGSLESAITVDNKLFKYSFGKDTSKKITQITNRNELREANSVFIPAKEVLSLQKIIIKSKVDRQFGFDETYYDLCIALEGPKTRGKSHPEVSESRRLLEQLIDGKIENDGENGEWYYKKGNQKYSLGITAEGIKKIAIFDQLLGNRYLTKDSIILIDEPEAGLHPKAISKLMEILYLLSKIGVQIFISTHSYFVIKEAALLAAEKKISIPFVSLGKDKDIQYNNLSNGMPDNEIIDQSIKLYDREIVGAIDGWK